MNIIQKRNRRRINTLIPLVIIAAVIALFVALVGRISGTSDDEGLSLTLESLKRASVQCYALEGVYPPDLEYLKVHYGVRPNEDKYLINYEYIASNLMPDITVLPSMVGIEAIIYE